MRLARDVSSARSLSLWLAAVMAGAGACGAEAQTVVQGRVLDAQSDQPAPNAVVQLVDPAGEVVQVTATDGAGRYELPVAVPGRYRLRAEQLGYGAQESEPFDVRPDTETVSIDLRIRPRPISIEGVEVSTDQANRRLRQFFGMSPGQLRIRPIRPQTIESHALRGDGLDDVMSWARIPNLEVIPTRQGPCYRFRARGCLPIYLDGAPLSRDAVPMLPLEMLRTVVVVLPNETVSYPQGAVHLFSVGFMR